MQQDTMESYSGFENNMDLLMMFGYEQDFCLGLGMSVCSKAGKRRSYFSA